MLGYRRTRATPPPTAVEALGQNQANAIALLQETNARLRDFLVDADEEIGGLREQLEHEIDLRERAETQLKTLLGRIGWLLGGATVTLPNGNHIEEVKAHIESWEDLHR